MAVERESTTRTVPCGKSCAASVADSQVPDSAADRCTDTIRVAPASSTDWYIAANSAGVGRDVLTANLSRSARVTSDGVTSTPSSTADREPSITRSGTTWMPR